MPSHQHHVQGLEIDLKLARPATPAPLPPLERASCSVLAHHVCCVWVAVHVAMDEDHLIERL